MVTEARIGRELELLRKPSPLGDERGEFEGGWTMFPDALNPAFLQAIESIGSRAVLKPLA